MLLHLYFCEVKTGKLLGDSLMNGFLDGKTANSFIVYEHLKKAICNTQA